MSALLKIEGLHAGYGEATVLWDVSVEVGEGEIVALLGSNGAGKTTLLRVLSQLIAGTGSIEFAGRTLTGLTPDEVFQLGLVHVPEGRQLFGKMSVEENLIMGAYVRRDPVAVRRSLKDVYELFPKLAERSKQLAGSLSGGEQQMVALARGLMAQPRLLAVDEMSLGLAPIVVDRLLQVLREIRSRGVTVLLVEQDAFAALSVADRGYALENGRIVRHDTADVLVNDPEVRRAYLAV
jgi:branched-chain amino acid transport system ATP-binding protein